MPRHVSMQIVSTHLKHALAKAQKKSKRGFLEPLETATSLHKIFTTFTIFFSAFDTLHPRQIANIQYGITIMGEREVSRPYRIVFFAEGERFLSFWRCHRPRKRAALVMWCG